MRTSVLATPLVALLVVLAPRALRAQSTEEARAAFQRARLATRADSAEDAYLTVALSHPTSPYAAESLLRLGQARLASNDAKQAMVYLQRLLADYPRSEHRVLAALWLARAQLASGNARAACTTVKSALQVPHADTQATALLRTEQSAACSAPVSAPTRTAPAAGMSSQSARFTIQVGAFRERVGARAFARGLEKAGYDDARVVLTPDNGLFRVRVGRYDSAAGAQPTMARLKATGYSPVVVSDRQREKPVPN